MTKDAGHPKAPDDEIEYLHDGPAAPAGPQAPAPPVPVAGATGSSGTAGAAGASKTRPKVDPAVLKAFKARLRRKDDQIRALKHDLAGLKDQYMRKLAEMENLRKRLEREKKDYTQFALNDILLELLEVVDNFERALAAAGPEADGKTFREGVDLISRQLVAAIQKRGVQLIEADDPRFDPAVHNAMMTEESDAVSEPEVGEVLQKGYLLGGRLLRPALVKVLVPRKKE
jgi:molecular chaperone GrpE